MPSKIPNWILWTIIVIALIGFTDATFLLMKRITGTSIPCFITTGCDTVSKSSYAVLFGVPLSAWGMIFYLGVGFLSLLYLDTKNILVAKLIPIAGTLGFLSSLYFIYVQKFLIGAFCIYCLFSAFTSTVLFGFGIVVYRKLRTVN